MEESDEEEILEALDTIHTVIYQVPGYSVDAKKKHQKAFDLIVKALGVDYYDD